MPALVSAAPRLIDFLRRVLATSTRSGLRTPMAWLDVTRLVRGWTTTPPCSIPPEQLARRPHLRRCALRLLIEQLAASGPGRGWALAWSASGLVKVRRPCPALVPDFFPSPSSCGLPVATGCWSNCCQGIQGMPRAHGGEDGSMKSHSEAMAAPSSLVFGDESYARGWGVKPARWAEPSGAATPCADWRHPQSHRSILTYLLQSFRPRRAETHQLSLWNNWVPFQLRVIWSGCSRLLERLPVRRCSQPRGALCSFVDVHVQRP